MGAAPTQHKSKPVLIPGPTAHSPQIQAMSSVFPELDPVYGEFQVCGVVGKALRMERYLYPGPAFLDVLGHVISFLTAPSVKSNGYSLVMWYSGVQHFLKVPSS